MRDGTARGLKGVNSLQLISREFDDKLQISCDFLGGFEEKA